MLTFTELPPTAPLRPGAGFPDHDDARLVHVLPAGLVVSAADDGTPRFALARYRDAQSGASGGALYVEIDVAPLDTALLDVAAADGWKLRTIGLQAVRARLRGWGAGLDDVGALSDWIAGRAANGALFAERCLLDPNAVQRLEALLHADGGEVEIEIEGRYAGLSPVLPVILSADLATVATLLGTNASQAFGEDGVTPAAIEAAVLSAPVGSAAPFELVALDDSARPDDITVRRTLAVAWRDDLFRRIENSDPFAEPRYRWREELAPAGVRAWDLSVWRRLHATWAARWSVRALFDSLDEPTRRRLFPAFGAIAPFASVPVTVAARGRLDERFVRRVQLDITHTSAGGLPRERSLVYPGTPSFERLTATYPALTDRFELSAEIAATLAPVVGEPNALPRPLAARPLALSSTAISWGLADAGVASLAVLAEDALFDRAARIAVEIAADGAPLCRAVLTRDAPSAVPAWPADAAVAPSVTVTAFRESDAALPSVTLHDGPVGAQSLKLRAELLEVLDADAVSVSLDPGSEPHVAYAAVTLEDPTGRSDARSLDFAATATWPCWRASRFEPLSYRFCVRHVPRLPDGATLPLVVGEWQEGRSRDLIIAPPAPVAPAAAANA